MLMERSLSAASDTLSSKREDSRLNASQLERERLMGGERLLPRLTSELARSNAVLPPPRELAGLGGRHTALRSGS